MGIKEDNSNDDFTGGFTDIPSIDEICKNLGISLDELENDESKFWILLSNYLKKRLIKLIYMEDKTNTYVKDLSKEVDLYLKIDSKLDKQGIGEDLLLKKLNQLGGTQIQNKSGQSKNKTKYKKVDNKKINETIENSFTNNIKNNFYD